MTFRPTWPENLRRSLPRKQETNLKFWKPANVCVPMLVSVTVLTGGVALVGRAGGLVTRSSSRDLSINLRYSAQT